MRSHYALKNRQVKIGREEYMQYEFKLSHLTCFLILGWITGILYAFFFLFFNHKKLVHPLYLALSCCPPTADLTDVIATAAVIITVIVGIVITAIIIREYTGSFVTQGSGNRRKQIFFLIQGSAKLKPPFKLRIYWINRKL